MTTLNEAKNILIDRGNMALEDKEWSAASQFFDLALNHDARCGEAYQGLVFAENRCSNLDELVSVRLSHYLEAGHILYEACPADTETINNTVARCSVGNFLTSQQIESVFAYDRTFTSETQSRTEHFNSEMAYIKGNAKVNRARQFLESDKKNAFETALKKIIIELNSQIEIAKKYDQKKIEMITNNYAAFVKEKVAHIEALSAQASETREKIYVEAVGMQEKAVEVSEFYQAAEKFDTVGEYRDAYERAGECRQFGMDKVKAANEEKANQNKKKAKKTCFIIAICILVVFAGIFAINSMKAKKIKEAMIGTTFEGTYHYSGSSYYSTTRDYTVHIIDDKYCSIEEDADVYSYSEGDTREYGYDKKVRYRYAVGLFKIRFDWESDEVMDPAEPFVVKQEDGYISLYTENFNSRVGLTLCN